MTNNKKLILACIDGSKLSESVCDYAVWLAQRVDGPLKLMYTIDHHQEMAKEVDLSGNLGVDSRDHLLQEITSNEHTRSKLRLKEGKSILQVANERVIENGFNDSILCLQHGSLIETLVELKEELRILVIGARGKIHEDQTNKIGAKLESMIRSLHGHILVTYDNFKIPQQIMIAYDGSEDSDKHIDMIANSPLYVGLNCHLVCVNKKNIANSLIENTIKKLKSAEWANITSASLEGNTVDELCDYQIKNHIDLTIMGAFNHTRLHDLILGSFTARMLLNTKTPLLLLR